MVSVIIPNYNHEQYLDERIHSVLKQTFQDFEIIILDDCSTDNSRNVIEKYRKNSHVTHIVYSELNSGSTFKQWEKGIEMAKGDLIWIAESDDSCDEQLLGNLVSKFSDEDLVLAFSRSLHIDEDGKEIGICPFQAHMNCDFVLDGKMFIKKHLSFRNLVVNASSALIKKSAMNGVCEDYKSFKGCGDWLLWIYLSERGKVAYLSEPHNFFRQHHSNTTLKLVKNGIGLLEMNKIFLYLKKQGYMNLWRQLHFRISRCANYKFNKQYAEVKDKLLKEWNPSFCENLLIYLYKFIKM